MDSGEAVEGQEVEEVARHRRVVGTGGGRPFAAKEADDGVRAESDVKDDEDDVEKNVCDVHYRGFLKKCSFSIGS